MSVPPLVPTSYHREVQSALRVHESGLWSWYASDKFGAEQAERVRLELLKATYRLDGAAHTDLHQAAVEVAQSLEIEVPVTFYQGGADGSMNAGLCFVPGEAHIVLTGPVLSRLDASELRALLGHELAHYRLWTEDDGSYRVADALVEAVASHPSAPASWVQLALRQRRYTEVYADRGSLVASGGDLDAAIRCLLKVSAGIEMPDAASYLRQVDEVVEKSSDPSRSDSHPELFLRAWAMKKWLSDGKDADALLVNRVQGPRTLETLDLLGQLDLTAQTRLLIVRFLRLPGLRTESIIAHARQFFPDLDLDAREPEVDGNIPESASNYFGYVLLDLATADPDLADEGLAAGLSCADECGFGESFEKLARKELRLTIANVTDLRRRWPGIQDHLAKIVEERS